MVTTVELVEPGPRASSRFSRLRVGVVCTLVQRQCRLFTADRLELRDSSATGLTVKSNNVAAGHKLLILKRPGAVQRSPDLEIVGRPGTTPSRALAALASSEFRFGPPLRPPYGPAPRSYRGEFR